MPRHGDPGCVLHQGVGNVDLLLIAIDNGKDRMVYAGPVLSHYEFEMPGVTRKSDSEWKEDLRAGRLTPAVSGLMRFECERARFYYTKAAAALPPIDRRSLLAAEIMGAIYFEILRRIERSGYDVFGRRIRVPRPYRALVAIKLWARAMFAR